MKTILKIGLILLVASVLYAQPERTFVKTIPVDEDCNYVVFALHGEVLLNKWEKENIRILVNVKTPEVADKVLDALVRMGRYNIEAQLHEEERVLIIDMPRTENAVIINAEELFEKISFEVYMPKGLRYKILDPRIQPMM